MYAFAVLASFALLLAPTVHAGVYFTSPVQSTTCTAGQSCQVAWVDDGQAPLLSSIGNCQAALYTGEMVLVQSLQSVDVSTTSSFSFTPDPAAGPNGQYYVVFTSTSISYQAWSGSFTLTGMTGTTPGGGSSTPATTLSGSSTSAGSSTPTTSPSGTPGTSTPSGTSTPPVTGTTPPTSSPTSAGTSPTLTTPTATTTGATTFTTPSTTTTFKPSTSTTPSNAAGRVGVSTSLGGLAAAFVLSYVLAF
ncbi:hypothetical protein V8E55_002822 [Tylopilus felleus]